MDNNEEAWPDMITETEVHDGVQPEPQRLSDYTEKANADDQKFDPEDVSYLIIMEILQKIRAGNPVMLGLSDRVTSHMVLAIGFWPEGRSYRIIYNDPWAGQSFLEEGKNVAGISATRCGDRWSVSHHELVRVLDGGLSISRKEENDG